MLSVLIPANNEADRIGTCLQAIFASDLARGQEVPEIIVMANGCQDRTAAICNEAETLAWEKGWRLTVLELQEGNKLKALNAGDAAARFGTRIYLDADVVVSPQVIPQLHKVLATDAPCYASGTLVVAPCQTWISRAYRRIYVQVPFITEGVPGCGLFAVNAAGRARWAAFPDIISDDTFVRLQFTPKERVAVPAPYEWPIVEGLANLIKVRARQDRGVREIASKYPELLQNDDKPAFGKMRALKMALFDPIGFAVYAGVALASRRQRAQNQTWSRGR